LVTAFRHNGEVSGIYDEPELYELACAYRDVPGEVEALARWFRRHARLAGTAAADPGSVLELAAGPAEHALEFARRGARATALDLSPAMCARARDKARRDGLELTVVQADMRDFRLEPRYDLVVTMLNSVCHLMTLDDLVAHLRTAAAHTAPGGLYIMELAHPADLLGRVPRTSSEWDSDMGPRHVHVRWGGGDDAIDPVTQVTREHVRITVRDAAGSRTLTDVVPNRFWTATEVTAATRVAGGFTVTATYGDFADGVPVGAPSAWRLIMVLRRDQPTAQPR
jgi:SAM-dependent methyltransferase